TVCGTDRLLVGDDFEIVSTGFSTACTLAVSGGDVMTPFDAVATFTIRPASRSACVIVCDAVHVSDAPGVSAADGGQTTVTLSSVTEIEPSTVTLPVFVTAYVYEMT